MESPRVSFGPRAVEVRLLFSPGFVQQTEACARRAGCSLRRIKMGWMHGAGGVQHASDQASDHANDHANDHARVHPSFSRRLHHLPCSAQALLCFICNVF